MSSSLFLVLGDQLFDPETLQGLKPKEVFMSEDYGLCTNFRHHRQKLIFFLSAMRSYRDELESAGIKVSYQALSQKSSKGDPSLLDRLVERAKKLKVSAVETYEVNDPRFGQVLRKRLGREGIEIQFHPSPAFLSQPAELSAYFESGKRPFMKTFYEKERKRLGILLEKDGSPRGGRWSFDAENRKKLPKTVHPPKPLELAKQTHREDVAEIVDHLFAKHPGSKDEPAWLPTTREEAQEWLEQFLKERLTGFGPYEDALTNRSDFVFHSALSPLMNSGLLTPQECVDQAVKALRRKTVTIASVEGFVRQIMGWREFIRGVDLYFGDKQAKENFWGHERKFSSHWASATTEIPPLDYVLKKVERLGYAHHIERLMVLSNLMLLCEIKPQLAYRWFMENFVDSAEWVMGPNVFGMGLFSDGGVFATKPYISGSNYIRKMSDWGKGDWCDEWDGLYWGFIEKHVDFFRGNYRLSMMVRQLDKMKPERKQLLDKASKAALKRLTR